jgi:hypothetical protein
MSQFIRQVTGSPVPFFIKKQEATQKTQSGEAIVALRIIQRKALVQVTGVQASPKQVLWVNRSLDVTSPSPEHVNLEPEGLVLHRQSPVCLSPGEWSDKFPGEARNSRLAVNSEPEATRARVGTPSPRTTPSTLLAVQNNQVVKTNQS